MLAKVSWNKYEAALLLDAYLTISNKPHLKNEVLLKLSKQLRCMALNAGQEIDDTYRNLNGMQWQYNFMEKAFQNKNLGNRRPPQIFLDVVKLYKQQPDTYRAVVDEAYRMSGDNNTGKVVNANMSDTKKSFQDWLEKQPKLKHSIGLILSVQEECSKYVVARKISKIGFWEMTDRSQYLIIARKLLGMRLFRVINRKIALAFDKTYVYFGEFLNENKNVLQAVDAEEVTKNKDEIRDESLGTHLVSDECIAILDDFSRWLLNEKCLSQATANGYASNLRSLSAYCNQTRIAPALFITANGDELLEIANQILQNTVFQTYNAEQHNRFSAALKKFLEFRLGVVTPARTEKKPNKKNTTKFPYYKQISSVLKERYLYGFRLESTIDIKRFRRYAEENNIELPESDEALKAEIKNAGVQIEDKVYLIEEDTFNYIRNTFEKLSSDGSRILFYDFIYDFDTAGMEEHYITSADHLKAILKQCQKSIFKATTEIFFARNFVSLVGEHTERVAVTIEMQRVWGKNQIRCVEELAEQLPTIPDDYIRRYLSGSTDFVWVSEGVYFNMERLIITEEEKGEILSFVAAECKAKGYASISDIPFGNTAEENYELTEFGLQEAIYNKVLIGKYRLNGKILTEQDGANLDVVSLAKQYLSDKEECTFDEMDKKITEIAGTRYRYMAYEALYGTMIRTDKSRYVAHRYVKFDVDAIDAILSEMISDRFVAIKEITSFALFPLCGLPWNHYLLESYCYSYSKKFCLKVFGFNDKNAGIIAEQSVTDGYNELLAQAAARAKIELSTEAVGQYYFETGYMGKRKFSDLESIVERAKTIREDL